MKIKEITSKLNEIVPSECALSFDNVGFLVGNEENECTGVYIALDVTSKVIDNSIEKGCNLILTHHPVIFNPLKRIVANDTLGKRLITLIENKLSVFSSHTNMDKLYLNSYLARLVGGYDLKGFASDEVGVCCKITPCTVKELADKFSQVLNDKNVTIVGKEDRKVEEVCIITGSGGSSEALSDTKKVASVLATAEIKHHIAIDAIDNDLSIINFGHYTSEAIFADIIEELLGDFLKKNNVPFYKCGNVNPFFNE